MSKKILLDMIKLRSAMIEDSSRTLPEAYFYTSRNINGLKSIRELATFIFTCRKCEDAPCISVCPEDALGKAEDGVISRYTNRCVSCKSCVVICPFGTMMTDFFKHHRDKELYYDLTDEKDAEKFIETCPIGTAVITDYDESSDLNIFSLNENILVKDYLYNTEKQ
jgi:Fe-S-cluster-containing hydrogenase component 2